MSADRPLRIELVRCRSTQEEMHRLVVAGAPAFTTVRADEQTAGRGRLGRRWEAPPGTALLVSILLRPQRPAAELAALSLVGGLAACNLARSLGVAAHLRWPNDVVTARGKLAGVLPELVEGGAVILGVGLNATSTAEQLPVDGRLPATSLRLEGIDPVPPAANLLDGLLAELRPLAGAFDDGGFAPVRCVAAALDSLMGRELELELPGGRLLQGVGAGIAGDGSLLVRTPSGVAAHRTGEVTAVRGGHVPS